MEFGAYLMVGLESGGGGLHLHELPVSFSVPLLVTGEWLTTEMNNGLITKPRIVLVDYS